jgi:hypothetical protein
MPGGACVRLTGGRPCGAAHRADDIRVVRRPLVRQVPLRHINHGAWLLVTARLTTVYIDRRGAEAKRHNGVPRCFRSAALRRGGW